MWPMWRVGWVALAVVAVTGAFALWPRARAVAPAPTVKRVPGALPFSFEPNVGQGPADVAFVAHRGSAAFLFSSTRMVARSRSAEVELSFVGAADVAGRGEARL